MALKPSSFQPAPIVVNSIAIAVALTVLLFDCSAFLFWLVMGVLDGHWNDFSLQVLFVCAVVSFFTLLLVAFLFGLGVQLSEPPDERKLRVLGDMGKLIDLGWPKAISTSTTCTMVVLTLLVLLCLSFWRDVLWWSETLRGQRALQEHRPAVQLYLSSLEIATNDRKPFSLMYLAQDAFVRKDYALAERYYGSAINEIKALPHGDNRRLLITAYQELSRALVKQKKYTQAESILMEAINVFGDPLKPPPPVVMRIVGSVAAPVPNPAPTLIGTFTLLEMACVKAGSYDEAAKTFAANISTFNRIPKPNMLAITTITELYAELLQDANPNIRVKLLNEAYDGALKLVADKFGPESEQMGLMRLSYGDRLRLFDQTDQAEQQYTEALKNLKVDVESADSAVLKAMNNLAMLYVKTDRPDEAEKLFKDELDLIGKWHNRFSSEVQIQFDVCHADYAALLRKLGRNEEADKIDPPQRTIK